MMKKAIVSTVSLLVIPALSLAAENAVFGPIELDTENMDAVTAGRLPSVIRDATTERLARGGITREISDRSNHFYIGNRTTATGAIRAHGSESSASADDAVADLRSRFPSLRPAYTQVETQSPDRSTPLDVIPRPVTSSGEEDPRDSVIGSIPTSLCERTNRCQPGPQDRNPVGNPGQPGDTSQTTLIATEYSGTELNMVSGLLIEQASPSAYSMEFIHLPEGPGR